MIEAFLLYIDEKYDKEILIFIIKKINEWYIDGAGVLCSHYKLIAQDI